MFNGGVPYPTDPASQRRAAHFAALRAIAEAASEELKAAGDAAAILARSDIGLSLSDATAVDFRARTRAADEAISAALARHQAAWNAFFDAVLTEDEQ